MIATPILDKIGETLIMSIVTSWSMYTVYDKEKGSYQKWNIDSAEMSKSFSGGSHKDIEHWDC